MTSEKSMDAARGLVIKQVCNLLSFSKDLGEVPGFFILGSVIYRVMTTSRFCFWQAGEHLKPEFVDRLSVIVVFDPLPQGTLE